MSRDALVAYGTLFEGQVASRLRMEFPSTVILHSTEIATKAIPGKDSTEIDLIMLHEKGVFVIESKNWKTSISGLECQPKWNGVGANPKNMSIFSPVRQNYVHIRVLRNALRKLGISLVPFHNFICVPDGCSINTDSTFVYNISEMIGRISEVIDKSSDTIDVELYSKSIRKVRKS